MRIALIGYGKMGKELEVAALQNQHEIVKVINSSNAHEIKNLEITQADVAIEFSTPVTVVDHIHTCFNAGIPIVVGTTGWYDHILDIRQKCLAGNHSLIYASNFSIGVNILFEINKVLAKIMNNQPDYDVTIEEIHHTRKLDSPSGTAITIANDIIDNLDRKKEWLLADDKEGNGNLLTINSKRTGDVVGTHIIKYHSKIDNLELKHEAASRAGFVQGALVAAEWITKRKGFFT